MSESNELLKSHSQILSNLDDINANGKGGDLDYDKVKMMISKSEKRVANSVAKDSFKHQEELREKIEKCVMQVTEFMRKQISSSRTFNSQIKTVNNKIEGIELLVGTTRSERVGSLDKESNYKRSLTTKRTHLTSPTIYRSTSASDVVHKKTRSLSLGQKVKERNSSEKRIRITPKRSESNKDFRTTQGKKNSGDRRRDDKFEKKYEKK